MSIFGRRVMQPRLVAYMADHAGLSYTYSGSTMIPLSWSEAALEIKVGLLNLRGRCRMPTHYFSSCVGASLCSMYL